MNKPTPEILNGLVTIAMLKSYPQLDPRSLDMETLAEISAASRWIMESALEDRRN